MASRVQILGCSLALLLIASAAVPVAAAVAAPPSFELSIGGSFVPQEAVSGTIGGIQVAGTFWALTGQLVVDPVGTMPAHSDLLFGYVTCDQVCTLTGTLFGVGRVEGLAVSGGFSPPGVHTNLTLIHIGGALPTAYGVPEVWADGVQQWATMNLSGDQRARVIAQARRARIGS